MKKLMILVMGGILAAAMPLWADTEKVGYTWTYRINGDTAEIYYRDFTAAISPNPTGAVTIPSTLGGKPVTSIGSFAFYYCRGLTSVTIPSSVTSIGNMAFDGCSGLTSVTIPSSVTNIGGCAFGDCSGLTSVTIPNSVTSIGQQVFFCCSSLTSVTIPNSVKSIRSYAFEGCSSLTSVTIPDSVTSIESEAFRGCSGLMSISVGSGNANYKSANGLLLSKDGKTLIQGVNGNVTIPDGVTSIGRYAFEGCSGLTSVTIPDSVTSIGYRAFSGCSGLTSVTIGNGVTSIGEYAFSGCSGLTSVTIPDSVESFDISAFDNCGKLWTAWYRTLANSSAAGGGVGGGSVPASTTIVQQVEAPYALTDHAADRAIASVTVNGDCAIDSFVLKDGKVYDSMLRIVNTASRDVKLTLPSGYVYETFEGVDPLTIPANSRNMLSITRTADNTFLVSREKLKTIQ